MKKYFNWILILSLLVSFNVCSAKSKKKNKVGFKEISISKIEKELKKEKIMAIQSDHKNFFELYKSLEKNNEPILFTVDPAFHILHLNAIYTMSSIEKDVLYPEVKILIKELLDYERETLKRFKGTELEKPLLLNVAYLNVAKKLVGIDEPIDNEVKEKVEKELNLINKAEGIEDSPIFGYTEDYSQYKVRGYYTEDETLKKYFKTMMYLGRMGFYIENEAGNVEKAVNETRSAILLCDGLRKKEFDKRPLFNIWGRVFNITSFFAGKSEDLTPYDYINIILEIKGDIYSYIKDRDNILSFIEEASILTSPKIISISVSDTSNTSQVIKSFKLFPQRFIPDSYIFQNLVYNKVGTRENPRYMPKSLDVMAVLGSSLALTILKEEGEFSYENYEENLTKLIEEIDGIKQEDWTSSLYMNWLNCIKENFTEIPEIEPFSSDKWRYKELMSSLGAWAELRHEMILYAKQSYTVGATAIPVQEKPERIIMVEPKEKTFNALKNLTEKVVNFLTIYEIDNENIINRWKELKEFYSLLTELSKKGLLTGEESEKYYWMSGYLDKFSSFEDDTIVKDDTRIVADVHTDPNKGEVLEVASGYPITLYASVKKDGKEYILKGGMFSFYEFTNPISNRLTDEKWKEMSKDKELPLWTSKIVYKVKER